MGAAVNSLQELLTAVAIAFKKPEEWYGDEEYAPNANAFLEYLDDVAEWVPAKVQVVLVREATALWRETHLRLLARL